MHDMVHRHRMAADVAIVVVLLLGILMAAPHKSGPCWAWRR